EDAHRVGEPNALHVLADIPQPPALAPGRVASNRVSYPGWGGRSLPDWRSAAGRSPVLRFHFLAERSARTHLAAPSDPPYGGRNRHETSSAPLYRSPHVLRRRQCRECPVLA